MAIDGDHGQVAEEPPEFTALREARVDRDDLSIRLEHVVRHSVEVVNEGEVDLGPLS
jgi:hypothetical protein